MNDTLMLLVLLQVIAHVVCDFFLQTDASCDEKLKNGFRSRALYTHALIAGVLSYALAFDWNFWMVSLIIASTHLLIDGWKAMSKPFRAKFFVDQILHLVVIAVGCFLYMEKYTYSTWIPFDIKIKEIIPYLFGLLSLLLCAKPSNIIIQEVMKSQGLDDVVDGTDEAQQELKNAGRLIGVLERLLTFGFVITSHFTAVGFIVAAKSILRYRDGATAKTEYVLVGTFLSIGIALVLGLVYNGMVQHVLNNHLFFIC